MSSENLNLQNSYYVVFNFFKDGQPGAGSKTYKADSGLTESLIRRIHDEIKESNGVEDVLISYIVKLDSENEKLYTH